MLDARPKRALSVVIVLVLVGAGGAATVATQSSPATSVGIDASPTDLNDAETTHAVVVTVRDGSVSVDEELQFNRILVDYSVGQESPDVSNVGTNDIDRIGIDKDGADEPDDGTRIDETATVNSVSGKKDGTAVLVETAGDLGPIDDGDEVVVVLKPVQHPQNGGRFDAEVTLNGQDSGGDSATDTIEYEYNNASALLGNQTTTGDSVVVERVNLSEGGWVAVHNDTGDTPGEVRGNSSYLDSGVHTDVEVPLDQPVEPDTRPELYATAHLDTNADRQWNYVDSGGSKDTVYRTEDGNPQTGGNGDDDSTATVTYNEPPTAEANGPYRSDEGGAVTLDVSGSSDPDGDGIDTSWAVIRGPSSVSGGTYDAPDDTDGDTTAVVELTVTDDDGDTDTDRARVDVSESDTGSDDDSSGSTGSGDGGSASTSTDGDSGDSGTSTPTPTATDGDDGTSTPASTPTDGDGGAGGTGDDGTADETQGDGTQDDETSAGTQTPADGADTPTGSGGGGGGGPPEVGDLGGAGLAILPLVALVLLVGGLYAVFGRRERE